MHEEAIISLLSGRACMLQILLKTRDHLFKALLINCASCSHGVEVDFVDTLREQARIAPIGHAIRNLPYEVPSLIARQMDIPPRVDKILLLLPVCFVLLGSLKMQKLTVSFAFDRSSPLIPG